MSTLNEQDLRNAEGWRPEEGDLLIGEVTEVTSGWSDHAGDFYPILTIKRRDNGESVSVHCFHTVLKNKILTLRPQVGQTVGIKYLGKHQHPKDASREVTDYVVKIEGGSTADPYAAFGATARPSRPGRPAAAPPQESPEDDIPF